MEPFQSPSDIPEQLAEYRKQALSSALLMLGTHFTAWEDKGEKNPCKERSTLFKTLLHAAVRHFNRKSLHIYIMSRIIVFFILIPNFGRGNCG